MLRNFSSAYSSTQSCLNDSQPRMPSASAQTTSRNGLSRPLAPFLLLVASLVITFANAVPMNPDEQVTFGYFIGNLTKLPSVWSRNTSDFVNACTWLGIECNEQGRVTVFATDASKGYFTSTIPAVIGDFASLEKIWFAAMEVVGTIPPSLFRPVNLTQVDLRSNFLKSSIPPSVLSASKLETLQLDSNLLTGTIPNDLALLPRLNRIGLGRNRFECPFPVSLYEKLRNTNGSECRFWGNNWDSRKDGTICGGCTFLTDPDTLSHLCNGSPWFLMVFFPAVDVITGIQNCNLFPFTVVQNAKNGTVTRGLTYRKLRMEVIDNTVAVFGVHPSGAVYRDEYVSFRFFSVDLFDIQPGLPGTVLPATLFASYPIQRFDNVTQVGDSTFEISVSWSNERIRFLKFIWTLNYQNTGELKFSAEIVGQSAGMFAGRNAPGGVSIQSSIDGKGYFFEPGSRLDCGGSGSLFFGETFCRTSRFNTTLRVQDFSVLRWILQSQNVLFDISNPFDYLADDNPDFKIFNPQKYALTVLGYGPSTGVRSNLTSDAVNAPIDDQGISVQFEILFTEVNRSVFWDPSISLSLLLPDPNAPPQSQQAINEAAAINLAAAIAVPIVVVALVGIIGIVALVPSVRAKVFPMVAAKQEMRKRNAASHNQVVPATAAAPAQVKTEEKQQQPSSALPDRSQRWTLARPTVETN